MRYLVLLQDMQHSVLLSLPQSQDGGALCPTYSPLISSASQVSLPSLSVPGPQPANKVYDLAAYPKRVHHQVLSAQRGWLAVFVSHCVDVEFQPL